MAILTDSRCLLCHFNKNVDTARGLGTEAQATAFARELMQIYLDSPAPDTVTGRVLYVYGEDTVEPFAAAPPQPWRDPLGELRALTVIKRQFTALQPATGLLVLRGDDDTLFDFVSRGVLALRQVAAVYASDSFDRMSVAPSPRLTVGVSLHSDLLELDVEIPALSAEELAGIISGYREHKAYHRLQGGEVRAVIELNKRNAFTGS